MTVAALSYSNCCFGRCTDNYSDKSEKPENVKEKQLKCYLGMLVFDAVATITFLVVGILGATGVIGLSPAASYGMIAGAGVILSSDLSVLIPLNFDASNPLLNKTLGSERPNCLTQKNPDAVPLEI